MALRLFKVDNNEIIKDGNSRADKTFVDSSKPKNKKSKKLTYMLNIGATKKPNFLNPNTKKAFNYLRLALIKASILRHFDLESHIWIETDVSGYAIGRKLS